jgi:hypothetical protein
MQTVNGMSYDEDFAERLPEMAMSDDPNDFYYF